MSIAPVDPDLLESLGVLERCLDATAAKGAGEGYELEIHARMAGDGMRYVPQFVRRITAPRPIPPQLTVL